MGTTSVIPELRNLRQEHHKFKASLVYTGISPLTPTKEEQPARFTSHGDLGFRELGLHMSPLIQESQELNAEGTWEWGWGAVVVTK